MKSSPLIAVTVWSACLSACMLLLAAPLLHAQTRNLPQLGAQAPQWVFTADKHAKECQTGPGHKDPCAEVEIDKVRYTVAWDAQSKDVTYLFTDDRRLVTDSGLSVGGTCRVTQDSGAPDPIVSYMKWVIDPKWKGSDAQLAGTSVWYAALHKDPFDPHYGDIVGFIQSRYIQLKP